MSEKTKQSYIAYGDIVYIRMEQSLLYSNGFYDSGLSLINSDQISQITFRNCLFRIVPSLSDNNDYNQRYDDVSKQHSNSHADKSPKWNNQVDKRIAKDSIEESYGKNVKYGDMLQFLHIESQEFIVSSKKYDDEDNDLLLLNLSKIQNESTFRLVSASKKDGELVSSDAIFGIALGKSNLMLANDADMKPVKKLESIKRPEYKYDDKRNAEYEKYKLLLPQHRNTLQQAMEQSKIGLKLILTNDEMRFVKFETYSKYVNEISAKSNKILCAGDYIRLKHNKSYLVNLEVLNANNNSIDCTFCFHEQASIDYRYQYTQSIYQILEITNDLPRANIIYPHVWNKTNHNEENSSISSKQDMENNDKVYMLKNMISGQIIHLNPNQKNYSLYKIKFDNFVSKNIYLKEHANFRMNFIGEDKSFSLGKHEKKIPLSQSQSIDHQFYRGFKYPKDILNHLIGLEKFHVGLMVNNKINSQNKSPFKSIGENNMSNSGSPLKMFDSYNNNKGNQMRNSINKKNHKKLNSQNLNNSIKNYTGFIKSENIDILAYNPKLCDLGFEFVPNYEIYYINQLESLESNLNKILSILTEDENYFESSKFENVLKNTISACEIIFHHPFESDITHHYDHITRIEDIKLLKQILMRELGIFDIIYNVILCIIIKVEELKKSRSGVINNDMQEQIINNKITQVEYNVYINNHNKKTPLIDIIIDLLINLCKVIRHSISERYNQKTCSSLLRIIFSLIFHPPSLIQSNTKYNEFKVEALRACKKIIYKENPYIMLQIENYIDDLVYMGINFNNHPLCLKLIKKIFLNRYPSNLNKVRLLFIERIIHNEQMFGIMAPKIIIENGRIMFKFYNKESNIKGSNNVSGDKTESNQNEINDDLYYSIQWFKTINSLIMRNGDHIVKKLAEFYKLEDLIGILQSKDVIHKLKILIMTMLLSMYLYHFKINFGLLAQLPSIYFTKESYKNEFFKVLSQIDAKQNDKNNVRILDFLRGYECDLEDFLKKIRFYEVIENLLLSNKTWVNNFKKAEKASNEAIIHNKHSMLNKSSANNSKSSEPIPSDSSEEKQTIPPLITSALIDFFFSVEKIYGYFPLMPIISYAYALCLEYLHLVSTKGICKFTQHKLNEAFLYYKQIFESHIMQVQVLKLRVDANKHNQLKLMNSQIKSSSQIKMPGEKKYSKLEDSGSTIKNLKGKMFTIKQIVNESMNKSMFESYDNFKKFFTKENTVWNIQSIYPILLDMLEYFHAHDLPPIIDHIKNLTFNGNNFFEEISNTLTIENENDIQIFKKICNSYVVLHEKKGKILALYTKSLNEPLENFNMMMSMLDEIQYNIEIVFELLYDIDMHFGNTKILNGKSQALIDQSPYNGNTEFWKIFKTPDYVNIPFKIKPQAINRKCQKILYLTHYAKILIEILKNILFLIDLIYDIKSNAKLYSIIKLISLILTIFVYQNQTNQNFLVNNSSFAEIFTLLYHNLDEKYSDIIVIFFEITRTPTNYNNFIRDKYNKIEIPQYLLDDMLGLYRQFLIHILDKDQYIDNYPNNGLLNGLHFIIQEYRYKDEFRLSSSFISNLLIKFMKYKDYNIIGLIDRLYNKNSTRPTTIYFPKSYYSMKTVLTEIRYMVNKDIIDMNRYVKIEISTWKMLLLNHNILFNFDLKNEILNTIRETAFNKNIRSDLIKNYDDFILCLSVVFWDIIHFLLYVNKNNHHLDDQANIEIVKEFLIRHLKVIKFHKDHENENDHHDDKHNNDIQHSKIINKLIGINDKYEAELKRYNLSNIIISVDYANIPFIQIWEKYIADGCLGFLTDLMLYDGEHFCKYFEENLELKNDEIQFSNFTKITLYLISLLINTLSINDNNTHEYLLKASHKLNNLSLLKQYKDNYTDDINSLCEKNTGNNTNKNNNNNNNKSIINESSLNISESNILNSNTYIDYIFQNNLTNNNISSPNNSANNNIKHQLYDEFKIYLGLTKKKHINIIANKILQNKEYAKYLIHYLSGDSLKFPNFKFVLKILRKSIEIINSLTKDLPIYLWEDISESDSKDFQRIQTTWREFGLTKVLFNILKNCNDEDIFYQACILLISYLCGSHKKAQQEFYTLCSNDHNNTFMKKLSTLLTRNFEDVKKSTHYEFLHDAEPISTNTESTLELNEPNQAEDQKFQKNEDYIHHPIKKSVILLRVLYVLCSGEFRDFQRFLKNQIIQGTTHQCSFNFLEHLKDYCSHFHIILNYRTVQSGINCFETLIEVVNGDTNGNIQDLIIDKNFLEGVTELLSNPDDKLSRYFIGCTKKNKQPDPNHILLKSRVISLLKHLAENSDPDKLNHLAKYLNIKGMLYFFNEEVSEFIDKKKKSQNISKESNMSEKEKLLFAFGNLNIKDYFINPFPNLINIYIILRHIWDEEEEFKKYINDEIMHINFKKDIKNLLNSKENIKFVLFNVFPKIVASVDISINGRQKSLLRIWFPKLPLCDFITKSIKDKFLGDVDRTNSQTKLLGLANYIEIMESQMESEFRSKKNKFGLSYTQIYRILVVVSNILTLTVNCFNVLTLVPKHLPSETYPDPGLKHPVANYSLENTPSKFYFVEQVLLFILLSISGTLVFINLWFYRKQRVGIKWVHHIRSTKKKYGRISFSAETKLLEGKYNNLKPREAREVLDFYGPKSAEFKKIKKIPSIYKHVKWNYWLLEIYFTCHSKELVWDMLFLFQCAASFSHHIMVSFLCLDMAMRSYTVQKITGALFKNLNQLIWTLVLLIISVLIYSIIVFRLLNGEFKDDTAGPLCKDTYQCFLMVFNLSLRAGGGLGDVMTIPPYDRENNIWLLIVRVIVDLSFFIFVITITLHIVFGMMVDAFRDLRADKIKDLEDQENICFICGLERSEYEKYGNFENHVEEEHSIWNYMFYLIYLKHKYERSFHEMTDIESHIYKRYKSKICDWFPYKTSKDYEKLVVSYYGTKLDDDLNEICESVEDLKEKVKEMHACKELVINYLQKKKKEKLDLEKQGINKINEENLSNENL